MNSAALGLILGQLISAPSGYTGTVGVGNRTEARARTGFVGGVDLETAPFASVALTGRRSSYSLGYGPRIIFFDLADNRDVTVMHGAGFRASYGFRRFSINFTADGSYGKINSVGLVAPISLGLAPISPSVAPMAPPQQTPTPDPSDPDPPPRPPPTNPPGTPPAQGTIFLLPDGILQLGSLRVGAGAGYAFSSRWNGSANLSYGMSGGLDFASQRISPPSRNGTASVSASYSLSANDALTTSAFASHTLVLTQPPIGTLVTQPDGTQTVEAISVFGGIFRVVGITEAYSHVVSRRTNASIGLGINYLNSEPAPGVRTPGGDSFNGTGFGSLGHVIPLSDGANLTVTSTAGLGAFYNPIVGQVQQTASLGGGATWTRRRLTFSAGASASTTIPFDENSTRTVTGSLGGGYLITRGVSVDGGMRVAAQAFPSSRQGSYPAQFVGFVAVTFTAPPVRF